MSSKYDFSAPGFWKKGKIIGTGGSSTVYEATIQHNQEIIAAKEIQIDGLSKDQVLAIEAEVNTIKSLEHNHIVNYLGTQLRDHYFYIFLEHADRGSLRQYYRKHGQLLEPQVACCTKQLLLGLLYLHGNDIAHRDIKGANVLLTSAGELKLADFGASKRYDTASIVSGLKGTPQWMAPEVIKGTQMTSGWMKADVWSLGCTVVEMLTGTLPYAEFENPMTAMYHIASGKTPPLDKNTVSATAIDFVETCCNVDPEKRPSVKELLLHAFVKDIDPGLRIDLKEEEQKSEMDVKKSPTNAQDLMSNSEMRVILSSDVRDRDDLHQSPDNSPPPSPPKDPPDINNEVGETELEDDGCGDDDLTAYNGLTRTTAKTSLLNSVESLSSSNTSVPLGANTSTKPSLKLEEEVVESEAAAAALKVLELQKTPSMHTTTRTNKTKQFPREDKLAKKNNIIEEVKKKTIPIPPIDSSKPSSTFLRRQNNKEETNKLSTDKTVGPGTPSPTLSQNAPQKKSIQEVNTVVSENDENKPIATTPPRSADQTKTNIQLSGQSQKLAQAQVHASTKHHSDSDSSRAESADELSPLNNQINSHLKSDLPSEMMRYKRERQVSTDSSGIDEDVTHQHPPSNSLKKNKKYGMSKSFTSKSEKLKPIDQNENGGTKPLSLAKHLSKKLNLSVNTNHNVDSDGGSSSGYCASQGSDSGSEYEYIEEGNEEDVLSQGKEEKKVNATATRNDTNTAPSYHDQSRSAGLEDNAVGVTTKKSSRSKKKKSSHDSSCNGKAMVEDHSRPVAPFTSEKLFLHNNLGADNFSRAGQVGAAAVRKEAALALNSHHSHSNHNHSHSKYGGYHAASKSSVQKHYTSGTSTISQKKNSKRSKSANVGQTGSANLVLPSLLASNNVRNGTAGGPLVIIPQLALRVIQSAPTVTRSLNLPPLMKSKTPSNKKSKSNSGSFASHSDQTGGTGGGVLGAGAAAAGGDSFLQSSRFVSDEVEQEGGILAPRKS